MTMQINQTEQIHESRSFKNKIEKLSQLNEIYYTLKPIIPRSLQLFLRRQMVRVKKERYTDVWPIDEAAAEKPEHWKGWPNHKKFAFVLLHDVDTQVGHDHCRNLMDLEESLGFRSSFHFVPERYRVSSTLIEEVKARGFGVGVHGLKHDGKLFTSREIFKKRAKKINHYLRLWNTKGFSSPSMLRKLEWMEALNIEYGTSTFDTDPFEPQPDGIQKIFPFWVKGRGTQQRYLEIPYTLPQDFTLFILMQEKSAQIWEKKMKWLSEKGGMAYLNTHPDYMHFKGGQMSIEAYDAKKYADFLRWVKTHFKGDYWHVLSSELADYFLKRGELVSEMSFI